MNKIASPSELQSELHRLLAYAQSAKPSREKIAAELKRVADLLTNYREVEKAKREIERAAVEGLRDIEKVAEYGTLKIKGWDYTGDWEWEAKLEGGFDFVAFMHEKESDKEWEYEYSIFIDWEATEYDNIVRYEIEKEKLDRKVWTDYRKFARFLKIDLVALFQDAMEGVYAEREREREEREEYYYKFRRR